MLSEVTHRSGRAARQGFTFVEVMISAALLAVVLAGVMGGYASMLKGRESLRDDQMVHDLVRRFAERLSSVPWEDLGTATAAWSIERPVGTDSFISDDPNIANSTSVPLATAERRILQTLDSGNSLGMLDGPTGLEDLQIYIEYYRAVDDELGNLGLMDAAGFNSVSDYRNANLTPYDFTGVPNSIEEGIVVYRLVITWGLEREIEIWGGRRE